VTTTNNYFPLTQAQIAAYRRDGFIQINDLLTQEEVDELAALTDEMNEKMLATMPPPDQRGEYQKVFLQIVNVWRRDARFQKFSLHPRLADVARRLIGCDRVRLWHDHLMTKLPGKDNKPTDWHQDFPYWPMNEPGPMSIWIPMQDVDMENGCMHFVPGSHNWNVHEIIYLDDSKPKEQNDIFSRVADKPAHEVQRVYVPLKRGSVTFHNGLTFHYAGKNMSDKPRRVLSIIYMADGTTYNGKGHVVSDEAGNLKVGEPFQGEFFPILA
jgi:ectoine hydroxylase-related dioxygenase (phytanoyl-CoA dioxygenase family)